MRVSCLPRRMRRRDWVIFALLAVLAWRLLLPSPLVAVGRWPGAAGATLTAQGVLCITHPTTTAVEFTQYRFNKWKRWAVRVEMGRQMSGISSLSSSIRIPPSYGVSPDGRILAVATVEGKQPAIHTFLNGKPLGHIRLPRTPGLAELGGVELAVLNSGQVWALPRTRQEKPGTRKRFPVYLFDGKQLLTGWYETKTRLSEKVNFHEYLSPDGAMLMVHVYSYDHRLPHTLEAVALRQEKNRIRCEHRNTLTTRNYEFSMFPGGRYMLLDDGTVHNIAGPERASSSEWQTPQLEWIGYSLTHNAITQRGHDGQRVLNVATGKSWQLPKGDKYILGHVLGPPVPSADGRYVATLSSANISSPYTPFQTWKHRLPVVGKKIREYEFKQRTSKATLSIYERPGKLRATRSCRYAVSDHMMSSQRIHPITISQNGRYVLLKVMRSWREKDKKSEVVLYRW